MKDRPDLISLVCVPHCRFYRPGEKEELSCRGYEFFREKWGQGEAGKEALEAAGNIAAKAAPTGEVSNEKIEHNERIERLLCARCEFREDDCDFMSGEEIAGTVPCGGYVLLVRLLAQAVNEAEEWLDEPV
ncbi:MAG TPA: hypothetical protein VM658_03090 [bacterium]|nr:hypothetical protein [bacterium]